MIRLAVTTAAQTFERMEAPLRERGIDVQHLQVDERTIGLSSQTAPWDVDRFDVGYVYPSRPMEGGVIDALLDLTWVNGRDEVLRSRNKAEVLARASQAGISTPPSVLVSNPTDEEELRAVYDRFDGPVVIKPNSTTRGVGVAKASDPDSFLGIADYLDLVHAFPATGDKSFLVQGFIPEARDLRIMVIDGSVVGAVERQRPTDAETAGSWKHNVHRGATAEGVAVDAEHRELAEDIAEILDIPILGVDVLVTEDQTYLSETNARPTIDDVSKYEDGFWDHLAKAIKARA